ncbi:hypothetical protein EP1X_06395 [Thermococcus sp. EP1]|uniref:hypothetical protein n=1 Tax=Thermococcus sp. EP1 TaxID=1591054 RepID=UPI0006D9F9FA|nr:hypothetical protein [Thermococcus sp. EP1]KPU62983.1 hypothetical protein EP1X_06395 [Thermococcus sp. EP1]
MRIIILMGKTKVLYFVLLFGILITVPIGVIVLKNPTIPIMYRAGVLGFIALWVGLMSFVIYRSRKSFEKVKNIKEIISISENEISFLKPLRAEVGYFDAYAYWSSSGKSRHYHVFKSFLKESEEALSSFKFETKPFLLSIAQDGEGDVHLPGIRILDKEYKDIIILHAKPNYKILLPQESFSVSTEKDFAEAKVETTQNGIKIIIQANLNRARRAKIELISKHNRIVKEPIGETKDFGIFEYAFPAEPIVIIGHYENTTPLEILRAGKFGRIIAGHGKFFLRLALDIPFKPDVKEEVEFEVFPEKEEKEITSWGL